MFGIQFIKVDPSQYVIHFKNGQMVRAGTGLSFFYVALNSTIICIPQNTTDLPFVFEEITKDFQTVTVQGQLGYRIAEPQKVATLLNFAIDSRGRYLSEDPNKLGDRLINLTQNLARSAIRSMDLNTALASSDSLVGTLLSKIRGSEILSMHGIEVLSLSLISLRPTPEMGKALEAEARENLQKKADQAIYARRNAAVEEERKIKESELNTELAVQLKRRQIRESEMKAEIAIEEQRAALIEQKIANEKKDADMKAYTLQATLKPLASVDWRVLMAASGKGVDVRTFIASAIEELAQNAGKIGTLNISPDLLQTLIDKK